MIIVLEHSPHGGSEQLENSVVIMVNMSLLRFHLASKILDRIR